MKFADTDWKRAGWASLVLLGAAASIAFGLRPGGFESGIGWFFALLPGAYIGSILFFESSAFLSSVAFWILTAVLSFLWYYGIAYAAINVSRVLLSRSARG
jgi:hypothetical protein